VILEDIWIRLYNIPHLQVLGQRNVNFKNYNLTYFDSFEFLHIGHVVEDVLLFVLLNVLLLLILLLLLLLLVLWLKKRN